MEGRPPKKQRDDAAARDKRRAAVGAAFRTVLADVRRGAGWSQLGLAEAVAMERTAISLLERGQRLPGLLTLFDLAEALETTPDALVAETQRRLAEGDRKRLWAFARRRIPRAKRPRKVETQVDPFPKRGHGRGSAKSA